MPPYVVQTDLHHHFTLFAIPQHKNQSRIIAASRENSRAHRDIHQPQKILVVPATADPNVAVLCRL
jgi:hypothetical protein